MNELIKVTTNEQGSQVVSARDLYEYLGFDKSQWKRWYEKNILTNQFVIENVDYEVFDMMSGIEGGRPTKDFAITTDFAKRLSMMARTEKGEQARKYFIECEQKLINPEPLTTLQILEKALQAELERISVIREKERLQLENEKLSVKAQYADKIINSESGHTITVIAKELGMSANELNEQLRAYAVQYRTPSGEWVLYSKYQDKGYTESRTHIINGSDGKTRTKIYFVWTEAGRKFIHELLLKKAEKTERRLLAVAN